MDEYINRCIFCGGNADEPDHLKHCDGRQGGVEDEDIPRQRETSVLSFYNAVNTGTVKTLQQQVYCALVALGASNMMGVNRYFQRQGIVGDSHSITPRFAELRDMGFIREVGERPCPITGQLSIMWEAIPLEDYQPTPVIKHRCALCGQVLKRSKKSA